MTDFHSNNNPTGGESPHTSMSAFRKYRRTQIAEMRPVTEADVRAFQLVKTISDANFNVSISEIDLISGSPKIGDMIARNPNNHHDQWLVAKQYFEDNFEQIF